MNTETETKLESKHVHNLSTNNNKNTKLIKCFCNDDIQCPPRSSSTSKNPLVDEDALKNPKLVSFLSQNKIEASASRFCLSETKCVTKRLQKRSGQTWLKYNCDQSMPESIRDKVIEYRDCRIHTDNMIDRTFVLENSPEYCCDNGDYCNVDLEPKRWVKDLADYAQQSQQTPPQIHDLHGGTAQQNHHDSLITPINLALSLLTLVGFIVALVLLITYLYRKAKIRDEKSNCISKNKNIKKPIYQGSSLGTQSTAVPSSTSSSCSPYSTTTSSSSTTNTSIIASKENSLQGAVVINSGVGMGVGMMAPDKLKIYEENKSDEAFEPLLKINNTTEETAVIKIHSPISQSTQSSGFVCGNSSSGNNNSTTQTSATTSNPSEFEWSGSGSGAGLPQCVQRTIARQIKLVYPCIGKGRFGEVYKGVWRGEHVAVKTFNSADEKSWENECQIYQTQGFRHDNILGFIAADNIDRGLYTELWLITEFHYHGSLYDYLTGTKLNPELMVKMALSIVNGLVHLHMPIESCKGKPALAHCDLKSKNILVKADLTCCIGDLGLALSGDKDGRLIIPPSGQIRTGTKRYMAPEILSKKIDTRFLDAFQKAEIYSLALIFWELMRSCRFEDDQTRVAVQSDYKLPYYEYLSGTDPDEILMRQIVCEQRLRPGTSLLWRTNGVMREFCTLTEELWGENPDSRLNALRIKKSLAKLKNNYFGENN